MTAFADTTDARDYVIPEGCPLCQRDLAVRVSSTGPRGVCRACGWLGRPVLRVKHDGIDVEFLGPAA